MSIATEITASTIQSLDPRSLLVDTNIRASARIDADFVGSVRDLGVLVPIVAVRTADGGTRVRFGHRRVAAAIESGLSTVPVVVVADESTTDASEVERLVTQWAENEHRTGLTNSERVAVIAQLSAFGVSAAQIARRTKVTREHVTAALTVSGSELATAATARYDFLDLMQAAVVAEFTDDKEAVTALVAAAKTGQFDHTAQRLRDTRVERQRRASVAAALTDAGLRVLDERPAFGAASKHIEKLLDANGDPFTEATHAECPGHAAYVGTEWGWVDPATGEPVPDDAAYDDQDDYGDDDQDDADDPNAAKWAAHPVPRYVCTDPAEYGHTASYSPGYDMGSTSRPALADMDEPAREAARAERRDVIESNKAWASAEIVRRDWLRTWVTRKTAPSNAATFLATAIAEDAHLIASVGGNHYATDLLGFPSPAWGRSNELAASIADATEARATVIALAQILAAYDDATDRNNWRNVQPPTTRYLRFIEAQGYALSPVERRACGDILPTD